MKPIKRTEVEQDLYDKWDTANRWECHMQASKFHSWDPTGEFIGSGVSIASLVIASTSCKPGYILTIFGVSAVTFWLIILSLFILSLSLRTGLYLLRKRKVYITYEAEFQKSLETVDLVTESNIFSFNKRSTILTAQYNEFADKIQTQLSDIGVAGRKLTEIKARTGDSSKRVLLTNILKELESVQKDLKDQRDKAYNLYHSVFNQLNSGCQALRDQTDLTEILKSQRLISASKFIIEENKTILLNMENCLALFDKEFKALNQDFKASYDAIEELTYVS